MEHPISTVFHVLFSNPLLNVSLASWCSAQLIKTIIDTVKHKQFDRRRLAGAGGMPSSHSAVTCSLLVSSLLLYGYSSPIFAIAFVLSLVVMYDATGVRWAAGLHAKAINRIVDYLEGSKDDQARSALKELIPTLNESLGHRIVEVICGGLLGSAIALIAHGLRNLG